MRRWLTLLAALALAAPPAATAQQAEADAEAEADADADADADAEAEPVEAPPRADEDDDDEDEVEAIGNTQSHEAAAAEAESIAEAVAEAQAGEAAPATENELATPEPVPPPLPAQGFWGLPRWHIAGTVDLGFLFLRPKFYFGWGTPHEAFVALETDPLISGQGFGAYVGLRGEIPWAEVRVGARYFFTFTRSFLFALDEFDHLQVRDRSGPPSRYLSLEAELGFHVPIGPVDLVAEFTGTYVTLVDEGLFVFEESIRVILDPPFVWSGSVWLRVRFGDEEEFYIQPGVEVVHLVERNDFVLRAGLRAGVHLWEDLDVRLFAMPALISPDSLGATGGDTFLLGLRYRWATDRPEAIVEEP